jgi:Tol biopolymer transport system component
MSEYRSTLERELERLSPPRIPFDQLARRRDRKRRDQRIRAGVLGLAIAIAVGWLGLNAIRSTPSVPADDPTPTPTDGVLRRGSEVLHYKMGELVGVDPQTGESRGIVAASDIALGRILSAALSADGRWVAFDVGHRPTALSVVKADVKAEGEPRQMAVNPGPWAWSPTTAQLAAVESGSDDGDSLILIDPATGDVVDLGPVVGDLTTLAWSPDGTQIAYGTLPSGSVYIVNVEDGSSRLLAEDVGYTYGIGGSTIHWSPDGNHIAIAGAAEAGPSRLYLVDVDGSGLRAIDDQVQDVAWSNDGSRLAYATFTGPTPERVLRIWTFSPEDEAPFLVHEEPSFTYYETSDLAWSPDGSRIAFTTVTPPFDVEIVHKVIDADGAGDAREMDELVHLSWGDGSYFCRCYG